MVQCRPCSCHLSYGCQAAEDELFWRSLCPNRYGLVFNSGFHCTVHASLSIRQPFMDPASVCFHARIASSLQCTSKPVPLSLCQGGSQTWRMQSMSMKQPKHLLKPRRLRQQYIKMKCLQNQQLLHGPRSLKFQFSRHTLKSFVFQVENMVLIQNLRGSWPGGFPGKDILKRNGKLTSASIAKHGPMRTWRENGNKQKLQSMKHINGVSKNGKLDC